MSRTRSYRKIVRLLKQLDVTSVEVKGSSVRVFLEGISFPSHTMVVKEHVPYVGHWLRTKKQVEIDDDIKREHFEKSIALHEVLERYFMRTGIWKLPYKYAHSISHEIEKKWHIRNYGLESWKEYTRLVERVYEIEKR